MKFSINSSTNDFNFHLESYEYSFEDDNTLILLDLNYSKSNQSLVISKIEEWSKELSQKKAESVFIGGFFIVLYDKITKKLTVFRDTSGIKTGYYNIDNGKIHISTQMHSLAKDVGVNSFSDLSVAMLLSLDFCFDGHTIYEGIHEFKMGSEVSFKNAVLVSEKFTPLNLAKKDNDLSFKDNVTKLRTEINRVHSDIASSNNVVYLSGGIDSCVMLAALDDVVDKKDIKSVSYKVKGTRQDETVYAKSIAKHLNIPLEIKEIDPFKTIPKELFEDTVLKMNNPYIGYWIFAPKGDLNTTFFAGQDTRLHTPDVHEVDSYVFDFYLKNRKLPFGNLAENLFEQIHKSFSLQNSRNKALKHMNRLSAIGNPESYLLKYVFKFKGKLKGTSLENQADHIKSFFQLPNDIKNKRQLYNEIVKIKWSEQYTDDIRYMQDLGRISSTYIAMPFYDQKLSEFSSSIPFDYASKFEHGMDAFSNTKVKVNKLVLREAYKDKLNGAVLYRKKAVSTTNFLLFEGGLGQAVNTVISEDVNSKDSFIKHYKLDNFVMRFLNNKKGWTISDQEYLMKIYYLGTLCVYFKNIRK